MTALLFQPHSDDAALFASFVTARYEPLVITVFESRRQEPWGVTDAERIYEDQQALGELGVTEQQHWPFPDDLGITAAAVIRDEMVSLRQRLLDPWPVFAPAVEDGGNPQHNLVGQLALEVFRNVMFYATYTGSPAVKSRVGEEVRPSEGQIARKLRALAWYRSQHEIESGSREHFLEDLREYVS
jgi:LmbE family N-acetylglucosaminyl deacetylase